MDACIWQILTGLASGFIVFTARASIGTAPCDAARICAATEVFSIWLEVRPKSARLRIATSALQQTMGQCAGGVHGVGMSGCSQNIPFFRLLLKKAVCAPLWTHSYYLAQYNLDR